MTKATDHKSSEFVKLLFIGNSGAGKTGALTSLVEAGYELRIIDMDSGLDALIHLVRASDPSLLEKIEFNTFRDKIKMTASGPKVVGSPKAYVNALDALEEWPDDKSDPAEWGPGRVLVVDSLTRMGDAAFHWAKAADPTNRDPRRWYKTAQDLIRDLLANLTSDGFNTNVIVISHIELVDTQGVTKGYASAIGKALGPKIPSYFNTFILSETKGSGEKMKRMIKTIPNPTIDHLKTPSPKMEAEYDIKDGLAKIFKELKSG